MKTQISLLLIVVLLANCQQSQIKCHYSCQTCVGQSYTLCSKCIQNKNITVVEDPSISQKQYINSNSVSGVCTGQIPPKANALGILILIICVGVAIGVRTPYSIYLISTFQSLSLISFVQIAWVNPVGYLLQSLQYFMIFNWFGSGYKIQDQTMRQRQYYRLDLYFHESHFLRNFAIIGIFNIVLVLLIIFLAVWKYKKDDQKNKNQFMQVISQKSKRVQQKTQNEIQVAENPIVQNAQTSQVNKMSEAQQQSMKQKILQTALKACLTMFYLLIQQSSLVIMVSLRFERPISLAAKGLSIIYCICLLSFLIYLFVYKLWIFPNAKAQYANLWRKIGLPVLVIVPYQITYLIVVFLLIFILIQGFFQYRENGYDLISRISLYKLIQFIVVVLAGAYIITELTRNIQLQTNIIRVFLAIGLLAFFICFFVETFFGVIETYCTNNSQNQVANSNREQLQNQNKINQFNHTEQAINNNDANIFENKNKVLVIEDYKDAEDIDAKKKKQQQLAKKLKQEQQSKKRKQQEQLQRLRKMREEEDRLRRQEENRKRQQQERRRKKQEDERKSAQEAQRKRKEQEQRIRKQQEQRKRRQQEQRRRKQQQQNRRKQREQQLKRKREEEEQAKRKKQQEQARRKKEQQQQMARRKKQQQQQQQQQKQRRKRKYMSQMDPELRKRYGL